MRGAAAVAPPGGPREKMHGSRCTRRCRFDVCLLRGTARGIGLRDRRGVRRLPPRRCFALPAPAAADSRGRRHLGATTSLTETLDLRADGTYSLSEVVAPVCVRAPCPAFPTTTLHTAGTFSASSRLVKLSPTAPDKRLPEAFDVVRSLHPLPSPVTTNDDGALLPSAGISLLAIERGIDITLTPAAEDCPPGTLKCSKCGVYPPGGVCRAFVCLPPGRRCLPVP